MPTGDYGKVIRLGQQMFMKTGQYASRYVGNSLHAPAAILMPPERPIPRH